MASLVILASDMTPEDFLEDLHAEARLHVNEDFILSICLRGI